MSSSVSVGLEHIFFKKKKLRVLVTRTSYCGKVVFCLLDFFFETQFSVLVLRKGAELLI